MKRKLMITLLASAVCISNISLCSGVEASQTIEQLKNGLGEISEIETKQQQGQKLTMEDLDKQIKAEQLTQEQEKQIEELKQLAVSDSEQAAIELNQLAEENEQDTNFVEKATEGVLNEYFEEDKCNFQAVEQVKDENDFSVVLDKVEDFEEAKDERENEEKLEYATDEIVVTLQEGTSMEDIDKLMNYVGDSYQIISDGHFDVPQELIDEADSFEKERLERIRNDEIQPTVTLTINADQTTEDAIEKIEQYEIVEDSSRNQFLKTESVVSDLADDTYINQQTYLNNIELADAWKSARSGYVCVNNIKVAVIDSGVRMSHEDLKGVLDTEYSVDVTQEYVNDSGDINDGPKYTPLVRKSEKFQDVSNHGTAVAGIIAAVSNNGKGTAGVMSVPKSKEEYSKLLAIKAMEDDELGKEHTSYKEDALLRGLKYAIEHGARVINMSFGYLTASEGADSYWEQKYQYYLDKAYSYSIVTVASAGNVVKDPKETQQDFENRKKCRNYPAACNHVISVAATDIKNQRTDFSCYGSTIDISAPGETICILSADGGYRVGNGTSFAAPLVSGVAALTLRYDFTATADEIENILKSTATPLQSEGMGAGLLNAKKAIQMAKNERFSEDVKNGKEMVRINDVQALSGKRMNVSFRRIFYSWAFPERLRIFRKQEDGNWECVKTLYDTKLDAGSWTYTDTVPNAGQKYSYKIDIGIRNGGGYTNSSYSNIVSAKSKK